MTKTKMLLQVDIADLKVDRRGSSDSTKLDHHEIVCPTIGAVNVYLQVSQSPSVIFSAVAALDASSCFCLEENSP